VAVLTDFDHESVFETILLACADPTREVRAAAARGLFRLSFDRSDAWRRIIETEDEFRMSHAVRAAIESGIVVKAFDRLVHDDLKIAYEAFVLVSLLIKSGNTSELFDAIRNHRDERVRLALLHTLKVHKDERTLSELYELQKDNSLTGDISGRIHDTILSMQHVAA
jgi:HEAT repeat protein